MNNRWTLGLLFLASTVPAAAQSSKGPNSPTEKVTLSIRNEERIRQVSQTLSDEIPMVIGHRGASGYLPEHTTEAVAFAHAAGADFIEQDVVMSRDGVVMVMHDVTLNDVTDVASVFPDRHRDGKYFAWDFTVAELKQLKICERFPRDNKPGNWRRFPKNKGDFHFATFEEHIELITGLNYSRNRNVGLYVELKDPEQHHQQGQDLAKSVLLILERFGYTDVSHRAIVETFDEKEVLRIRTELKCRLPLVQLLLGEPSAEKLAEIARVADGVGVQVSAVVTGASKDDPSVPTITSLVQTARQHSLMVHVWTFRADALPEYAPDATTLLTWLVDNAGIDGIFTDQPDVVYDWRKSRRQGRPAGQIRFINSAGQPKP